MARSLNPVDMSIEFSKQMLKWAQSLHSVLNGQVSMGTPTAKDSSGQYNKFSPDNTTGVLIRVSPSGGTDNKYAWAGVGVGVAINHGLQRQPIGAHLVSSNKDLRIWQTVTPDSNMITIAPSDNTAYATIYIF